MTDNFERLLNEAMDVGSNPAEIQQALSLVSEIKTTEDHLKQLKEQLAEQGEALCAAVSLELRKLLPKMEVRLSKGGCTFAYKARALTLVPNFDENVWVIKPGPSPKDRALLSQLPGESLKLPLEKYKDVVQAIAKLFVGKYMTLRGGKVEAPVPSPEEAELPDQAIDAAVQAAEPVGPQPPAGRRVEIKGVSKTPGGAQYA